MQVKVAPMAAGGPARYVVVLGLSVVFLCALANAISKWRKGKISETQMVEKKSAILFPSVTVCPVYHQNRTNVTGIKTLSEYYSNMPSIDNDILDLQHPIETENGQA